MSGELTYGEKLAFIAGRRTGHGGATTWDELEGKPSVFPPSAHEHTVSDISDFPSIPTDNVELANGAGYVTSAYHDSTKQDTLTLGTNLGYDDDGKLYAVGYERLIWDGTGLIKSQNPTVYYTYAEVFEFVGINSYEHRRDVKVFNNQYSELMNLSLISLSSIRWQCHDGDYNITLKLASDNTYTLSETKMAKNDAVTAKQDKLTAGTNITIENNVISATGGGGGGGDNHLFAISEDMFDLEQDPATGVSPYSTSYKYTNITIHADAGVEWVEGAVYSFSLNTKVATSTYRNVRLRIGESDSWHPLCEYTTGICAGSTYFVKEQTVLFVYKTTYYSYGALHRLYDANSNTYIGTCETAAATAAKTANGTYPWDVLTAGLTAPIIFRYANTAKSGVTLNWNSKGAKELWLNGAAISTDNYSIPVGTWMCYYDGTRWHVRTDGKHANPALNVEVPTEDAIAAIAATVVPTDDITANTDARHTHSNASVLDGITAEKVAAWDACVADYTAALGVI